MSESEMNYTGKKAIVFGGSHGIGLATAQALVEGGADVLITGSNEPRLADALQTLGAQTHGVRVDAADLSDLDRLRSKTAAALGAVDLLFINAGIAELEPFEQVSEASYDRHFNVNTKGAFFCAQRLAPLVREGGAIVFTTVTPATGTPTMSVYSGTKAALRAFVRVLAAELLPRKIRVNAVAPGFIRTPTLGIANATAEERAEFERIGDEITPMKRHGTPEEVARAVLFLAFEATFTTGAELPVDGGMSQVDRP